MSDGWETLLDIYRTARDEREQREALPPVACPIDGEPLEENSEGVLNCPAGNYRWSG